ncbi:Phosphorylase b kinase gamma catalytic chain, skeletal muscle heart isoform [Paramuricea clavata]|uniref:Phosphorylase b kinase gamma catalytic chain, skeletal muscle heart isoform n=1 Tax=Paramuricea clavata TaxID=317549 RepID=A0A7D9HAS5_PARCT|nr:Phosphorylase b kinase gamma catalytic chain, skeletal muscle heart isoform [Paramuricea clavata]
MDDSDGALLEENEATQIFYAKYKPKEKLGAGLSSVVRKCVHKASGQEYAVKIVDKLSDHGSCDIGEVTKNEADILKTLSGHKNISGESRDGVHKVKGTVTEIFE